MCQVKDGRSLLLNTVVHLGGAITCLLHTLVVSALRRTLEMRYWRYRLPMAIPRSGDLTQYISSMVRFELGTSRESVTMRYNIIDDNLINQRSNKAGANPQLTGVTVPEASAQPYSHFRRVLPVVKASFHHPVSQWNTSEAGRAVRSFQLE